MVSGDVEIPGRGVVFSPKVLLKWDSDTWNVELVVRCAVKGTNLTDRGLCDRRWFNRVADPVQRVQGDGSSNKGGDGNESIQGSDNYAGLDSGGEIL